VPDWPPVVVAVALALFCVADVDASGVVGVPPDVVVWPVLAVPLADGVPVLVVLPGVWVCCCVETEPCAGGSNRDGGKTSVLERLGVDEAVCEADRSQSEAEMVMAK